VPREELEEIVGRIATRVPEATSTGAAAAPGMLPQHYAPRTEVRMVSDWRDAKVPENAAALAFQNLADPGRFRVVEVLSAGGDLREAATRFFAALRRLDASGAEVILAERFPEKGLGIALNDRLTRAAATGHTEL
jgi:L-threonylcarbamoyladenylate synthase